MATMKKITAKDVKQKESLYIVDGATKWYDCFRKLFAIIYQGQVFK